MTKPLLFVHIPKTAGLSIMACGIPIQYVKHSPVVNPLNGKIIIPSLHMTVRQPFWKDYDSFTIVRDPTTRFVSAYAYLMKGGRQFAIDKKYQAILSSYTDINAVIGDLPRLKKRIVHFVDQASFVADSKDRILVDHVIRFESMREELLLLHPGFSAMHHVVKNSTSHPHIVLTEDQKNKIRASYERDGRLFGYP